MSQDNSPFRLTIDIDPTNAEHVLKAEALLRLISPGATVAAEQTAPAAEQEPEPKRTRQAKPKTEPAVEQQSAPTPAPAPEPEPEPEPEQEPEELGGSEEQDISKDKVLAVTREDLRALVQVKATSGHRDAVKAKLTELGAANVSQLDVAHFYRLKDFLESL